MPGELRADLRVQLTTCLGQVIAERRKDHVLDSVWFVGGPRSMPSVACHVGVLRTELDPAPVQFLPRSIQQLEPDARGTLNHYARICRTSGAQTTRQESARPRARLGVAARINELRRPITHVFLGDWVIVSRST